jgi:hypothetical protein
MVGTGKSLNVTCDKLLHDLEVGFGFVRDIDRNARDYFAVLVSVEPPCLCAEKNFERNASAWHPLLLLLNQSQDE